MDASYKDETGADYDELVDTAAAVCIFDDPSAVADLYTHDELNVPADLYRSTTPARGA
jgi:hypothetical protein